VIPQAASIEFAMTELFPDLGRSRRQQVRAHFPAIRETLPLEPLCNALHHIVNYTFAAPDK